MSLGYPSKSRARRAFWRGVAAARRNHTRNPYLHPRLQTLWERGRARAQVDTTLTIPPAVRPRAATARKNRPSSTHTRRAAPSSPKPRPNPWRH